MRVHGVGRITPSWSSALFSNVFVFYEDYDGADDDAIGSVTSAANVT